MQRDPMEAAGDAIREQFDRLTWELSDARMEIATLKATVAELVKDRDALAAELVALREHVENIRIPIP